MPASIETQNNSTRECKTKETMRFLVFLCFLESLKNGHIIRPSAGISKRSSHGRSSRMLIAQIKSILFTVL